MKKFKKRWKKKLKRMAKLKPESLYIHIPFCAHICKYCDFTKLFYNERFVKPYLNELFKELDSYKINKVKTIYIGGGTPTSLSDNDFEKLLQKVKPYLCDGGEFSVEANVENLSKAKLDIMSRYGVTRLSIGVESTQNRRLKEIGRSHTYEDAVKVVNEAKKHGFDSINVDLIYGFNGQSIKDLENDLNNVLALDVDHISIYSLIVSPGTVFHNMKYKEQDEEESAKYYEYIVKILREHGYERYEVSNFARNKKYAKHNLTYWHDNEYYGIGLGASGYINGVRYENTKSLDKYLSGDYIANKEIVTKEKDFEYFLLTNLRLESGFLRKDFKKRFGIDFTQKYGNRLDKFVDTGDLRIDENRVKLTDQGMLIMDYILLNII